MQDNTINNGGWGVPQSKSDIGSTFGRPKKDPDTKSNYAPIRIHDKLFDIFNHMSLIAGENANRGSFGAKAGLFRGFFIAMYTDQAFDVLTLNPVDFSKIDFINKRRLVSGKDAKMLHPPKYKTANLVLHKIQIDAIEDFRHILGDREGGLTSPRIMDKDTQDYTTTIFMTKMLEVYIYNVVMDLLPQEHENPIFTKSNNVFSNLYDLEAGTKALRDDLNYLFGI